MRRTPWNLSLLAALLIGSSHATASAALHWERTRVEQTLPAGIELVEVKFAFSNPENHPVTILHLQPSCGCTTPTLEKYTFAPGETGVLTARFDGRNLSGVQTKTIEVDLDDQSKPVILTLQITLPAVLEVSPRALWWKVGGEPNSQEAILTLNSEAKSKITSVKSDNSTISASLQPGKEPGQFRLIVQPLSTATALQASVTIAVEVPGASPRNFYVFTLVR